ncbi:MAG: HD domain-containing phosphohydrolase [Bacillota bacterium]
MSKIRVKCNFYEMKGVMMKDDFYRSLINPDEAVEETKFKYKTISEEKETWERRLHEIADVLRLENDLQFQRIIENLPFSLDIISIGGTMLYANPKCLELFEIKEDAIGTKCILDSWIDSNKRKLWVKEIKKTGVVNDFEMHLRTGSGREFWAIGSGIMIQYQDQPCILSTKIDITERKRMESELKSSEEKYRLLTEFSSDVIWVLNIKKNRYTYVSPSVYYLTGQTVEEVMKLGLDDILTPESLILTKESINRNLQDFMQNPDSLKSYIMEIRQKCKSGEIIWIEASFKFRYNDAGEVEMVGASRNIEERKKAEREVVYLSYHDQLTGLYNRRFYEEELQRMNFFRNLPITLVIADVNGLKLTNDAFGHFAGDNLLKRFTNILIKELSAEDVAARIGGDEFAILFPKTDSAAAEERVNHIKEMIRRNHPDHPDHPDHKDQSILSVSFGWAAKETVDDDFNAVFIQAEDHMYQKKLIESAEMKTETIQMAMRTLFDNNVLEQQHSENVARLCKKIGISMGLSGSTLQELELLGQMHDIGKIGVSEEILNKKKKLSQTEWLEIKRHPEIGYQILRSADEFVHIAESVLSHHERVDGRGYPRNLKADEIPLHARILSVAEAYDFMIGKESYGDSSREDGVISELLKKSGTQFDPEIVRIFIEKVLGKDLKSIRS